MNSQLTDRYYLLSLPLLCRLLSLPFVLVLILLISGCEERVPQEKEGIQEREIDMRFPDPVFSGNRTLDTIIAVDLDDDGRREYVVTSIEKKGVTPGSGRGDRLEIYQFDTVARSWKVVLTDSFLWSTGYALMELTGDRATELVVATFGGGNDPASSRGIKIYTGHGKEIRRLVEKSEGNPEIRRVEGASLPLLLIYNEFWPEMVSHAQATLYISDLLSLEGGIARSVRQERLPFFRKEAEKREAEYRRQLSLAARPDTTEIEMEGGDLYVAAAATIIALGEAEAGDDLRSFWHNQQDTLAALLFEEEFHVLSRLYADRVMK